MVALIALAALGFRRAVKLAVVAAVVVFLLFVAVAAVGNSITVDDGGVCTAQARAADRC